MTTGQATIAEAATDAVVNDGRGRRLVGFVLVALALAASLFTFATITNLTPVDPTRENLQVILLVDAVLVLGLLLVVSYEAWRLARSWIEGRAAARLHLRIVVLFSLMASAPAALVAGAFTVTIDQGLDRWFETRTRTIIDNVLLIASAYMQENSRVLRADLIGIASVVDAARPLYDYEPGRFDALFEQQSKLRDIAGAYLLDRDAKVLVRTEHDLGSNILMPPEKALEQAAKGDAVIISGGTSNQVGAVLKLRSYDDTYLYVLRVLDAKVIDNMRLARESAVEYRQLESSRADIQLGFGMVFAGLTVVFLLGAVWVGLAFANGLVAPIRRLITAADDVARGNLSTRVPVGQGGDDLASLATTFNNMTDQLRTQRAELLAANDQVDRRRRFTEAVLSGVTAAVVGVTKDGYVSIVNRSGANLIGQEPFDIIGYRIAELIPELTSLLGEAAADDTRTHQSVVSMMRRGNERIVSVRVSSDHSADQEHGFVVTLDDITDLVSAQRTSAWADVARRIAHEIKNPLTPIQLSAERIRRRFGKIVAEDDRRVFDQCVDTIIRQVGDIGRMVDEFSGFARMPKPAMEEHDLSDAVREAMFLQSVANPDIAFESHLPDGAFTGWFDHRLISQVVTNLVKNAVEAITALSPEDQKGARVDVHGRQENGSNILEIIDTGIGLPATDRHRLLEPYMTTREKGTGLGLAIVRKIVEEHDGSIELLDSPAVANGGRGAMVRLTLPIRPKSTSQN